MIRAAITSVGHFLPEDRLTNFDLEKLVDTNDEWIRSRTGIIERRILRDPEKATSYMATEAAREVIAKRGIDPQEIDVIIIGTVTPDMFFPATACLVQENLGIEKCWGFDVSAACSGFLFALSTGIQFITSGKHKKVLVIGADKMSSIMDYTDRNTCILFGDGAGAVLLEPAESENAIIDSIEYCDASNWEALCMPAGGSLHPASHETVDARLHHLTQEGRTIFKVAVKGMADVAVEIMEKNGLKGEDIRYLVPHQANKRIIEATARRMGITMDKVMINIHRYGNTTAGTLPLCLYDWESELRKGDNLVMASFGGGFSWGAVYVKWAYDGVRTPETSTSTSPA